MIEKLKPYRNKKTHLTNYGSLELFNDMVVDKINEMIYEINSIRDEMVYRRDED